MCGDHLHIQAHRAEVRELLNASVTPPVTGFMKEAPNDSAPWMRPPMDTRKRPVTSPCCGGTWAPTEEAARSRPQAAGAWEKQMYTLQNNWESRAQTGSVQTGGRPRHQGVPAPCQEEVSPGRCVPSISADACTAPRMLSNSLSLHLPSQAISWRVLSTVILP